VPGNDCDPDDCDDRHGFVHEHGQSVIDLLASGRANASSISAVTRATRRRKWPTAERRPD